MNGSKDRVKGLIPSPESLSSPPGLLCHADGRIGLRLRCKIIISSTIYIVESTLYPPFSFYPPNFGRDRN